MRARCATRYSNSAGGVALSRSSPEGALAIQQRSSLGLRFMRGALRGGLECSEVMRKTGWEIGHGHGQCRSLKGVGENQLCVGQLRAVAPPPMSASGNAALRPRPEICQSIAAHSADYERDSANEDSQSCPRHPPPKARRDRALGSDARYTAAHPARHSYTADRLAETPRARPLLDSHAFDSTSCSGLRSASTGDWIGVARVALTQARPEQTGREQTGRARGPHKPRLGRGEVSCPPRSGLSSVRARTLQARA